MLSQAERDTLFSIARESISAALRDEPPQFRVSQLTPALEAPAGAFVTLQSAGELRGCVGSIVATGPLYKSVAENARNAAFRDPRFPALTAEEYGRLSFEISVMGPIESVTTIEEIRIGRDGLIVRMGSRSGLLLPQVATEHGWDRNAFLSYTCMKAGLPDDAWLLPGCRIEKFSAEVFAEQKHPRT